MSGNYNMNNSNNKGSMRGGFQDTDGWIQQGSNKGRNNNTNPSFDPSKFKAKAVSGRSEYWKLINMCLSRPI